MVIVRLLASGNSNDPSLMISLLKPKKIQESNLLIHDHGQTELNTCARTNQLVNYVESVSQNDPIMRESFWQKISLVTHILFEPGLF